MLLRTAATCESLRPASLLEIAAFSLGIKPALRFVVSDADATALLKAASDLALDAHSVGIFLQKTSGGWQSIVPYTTDDAAALVGITHCNNAKALVTAEMSDATEAGIFLGYPECCVRSLSRLQAAASRWPLVLLSEVPRDTRIDARLNRFAAEWGGIGLIGELFPCSLCCQSAASYSQSLYDAACALGLKRLAAAARSDALASVTIDNDGLITLAETSANASAEFFW